MDFSEFRIKHEKEAVVVRPNTVKDPVVSVCVQTYQHKDYIRQCLDSILSQEVDFDFEILIGDDGSSDGTREICLEYKKKHPDLITLFLHHRANNIQINNRPTGRFNFMYNLYSSRGKYIAFCEGDDYWTDAYKLSKQVKILELNNDCVACHHWQKLAVKDHLGVYTEVKAPEMGHGFLRETKVPVSEIFKNKLRPKFRTILFRNIIKNYGLPEWLTEVQFGDEPLNFILGKWGDFYFLNEEMAVYRQTDTGSSSVFKNREGYILGNLEWIRVWSLASDFHDHLYRTEAVEGMNFFLNRLVQKSELTFSEKKRIVCYIKNKLMISPLLKLKYIYGILVGVKL